MGEACEAGCERQPSSHLPLGFVSMNEGFGAAQHTIALITAKQRTPIRAYPMNIEPGPDSAREGPLLL
jgi:hypothetical protein